MTERKVLNKYYPPDYDPRKLSNFRAGKGIQRKWVQRVMAPFNMKCNTCGEFIYKGKKFNARREKVIGEDYLGIAIWRFYMRCTRCLAEITFKTDLENCDYAQEHGSTRLFEAEKCLQAKIKAREKKEEEEAQDPMKMLEKRTMNSRMEMDDLAKLEELRDKNRRQVKPDYETMLAEYRADEEARLKRQEEEDEEFVQSIFGKKEDGLIIRRLIDDECVDDANNPLKDHDISPTSSSTLTTPENCFLGLPSSHHLEDPSAADEPPAKRQKNESILPDNSPTVSSDCLLPDYGVKTKTSEKSDHDREKASSASVSKGPPKSCSRKPEVKNLSQRVFFQGIVKVRTQSDKLQQPAICNSEVSSRSSPCTSGGLSLLGNYSSSSGDED